MTKWRAPSCVFLSIFFISVNSFAADELSRLAEINQERSNIVKNLCYGSVEVANQCAAAIVESFDLDHSGGLNSFEAVAVLKLFESKLAWAHGGIENERLKFVWLYTLATGSLPSPNARTFVTYAKYKTLGFEIHADAASVENAIKATSTIYPELKEWINDQQKWPACPKQC
jgi:hypothetical protein